MSIDFRDWKWLSNFQRYQIDIEEPEIITGVKEGTIDIDFSKMEQSDREGKSLFEVAGRMYYEAHVFGYQLTSFTSSGFLDRLGYTTPYIGSSLFNY